MGFLVNEVLECSDVRQDVAKGLPSATLRRPDGRPGWVVVCGPFADELVAGRQYRIIPVAEGSPRADSDP